MQSILSFYRDVYAQELSHAKTMHLYSSRVLKRFFLSKNEEILNDQNPCIPLGDKYGEEIVKTLELRSSEVELKYYSFARISRFVSLRKFETTRVYPLFSYTATASVKNGEYYLHIDKDSREVLKNNIPKKITGRRDFKRTVFSPLADFHFASNLAESIEKGTPDANAEELLLFPNLWSDRKIKSAIRKDFVAGDEYIPIGVLAIVEKENSSFTTLDELIKMGKENSFSAPLSTLFEGFKNHSEEKTGIICEELNKSQFTAVQNSNEKIVSVISGPPGTGKSFTIANLTAEKVSKGQSILVTSKNKEALDVIEAKIKNQLGIKNLCVNPSQDENFGWMKEHLDFVLGRQYKKKNIPFHKIQSAFASFQKTHDIHLAFEKKLMDQFRIERNYTKRLDEGLSKSITAAFRQRIFESRGKTSIPLWEALGNYYKGIESTRKKAIKTLHQVNTYMLEEGIRQYRSELRVYLSFLRARDRKRKETLSKKINYEAVLKAFPVWLVRANDISRVLPLEKEAFDILIIDEASQCDIPSMIPLMQRAKKVVIAGDTKQLTHISFISKAFEATLRAAVPEDLKHLCQHRNRSILHLAEDFLAPQDRVQLNEHFRSQFPIIAFSNDQFYQNRLDILTKRPISVSEHVQFIQTSGNRTKGYNATEARALLAKVRETIDKEAGLPKHLKTSIGILSPFRKQVDHLFNTLIENFSVHEIKAHQIIVGTAFTFQGNERDVMHISLGLDNKAIAGSFTFLNRKDVFNVSITRARNMQYIYHSFTPARLNPDSTIAHFFRFYDKNLPDDTGTQTRDEFCLEVASILQKKNLKTWTRFGISGVNIDLLTQVKDQYIGIDLIGFPGEMEDYYALERYKMMERGKIRLFPLSYPLWMGDRARCIEAITNFIAPTIQKKQPLEETEEEDNDDKKPRRKYTKFDITKVELREVNISKPRTFSIKSVQNKTKYGQIWAEITEVRGQSIMFLWFKITERHKHKGLEEQLINGLITLLEKHGFGYNLYANVRYVSVIEKAILEKFGFTIDHSKISAPYPHSGGKNTFRMVKKMKGKGVNPTENGSFDLGKISVLQLNTKNEKDLFIQAVSKNIVYCTLKVQRKLVKNLFSARLSIDRKKDGAKGVEEKLLNAMNVWLAEKNYDQPIFMDLEKRNSYLIELLCQHGFIRNYEGISNRPENIDQYVRFPTQDEREFYSEHVITERMGEKIYMQTQILNSAGGVRFKMKFHENVIGQLEVTLTDPEKGEAKVHYQLDSNFVYPGLEERLFEALICWQKRQKHLTKLVAFVSQLMKDERLLFERYGFSKIEGRGTPKGHDRFVKFSQKI